MTISTFYPVAVILFAMGTALMWDTSPYTLGGGDSYQTKRTRRLIGEMILLTAALSLGIAVIS